MWCGFWYADLCTSFLQGGSWEEHVRAELLAAGAQTPTTDELLRSYFEPRKKAAEIFHGTEKDSLSRSLDAVEDFPAMCRGCVISTSEPDVQGRTNAIRERVLQQSQSSANAAAHSDAARQLENKHEFMYILDGQYKVIAELNLDAYVVLVASSVIVALAICRELKDIQLCKVMVLGRYGSATAGDERKDVGAVRKQGSLALFGKDKDRGAEVQRPSSRMNAVVLIRSVLAFSCFVRRFALIPLTVNCVPKLVINRGRDSLNICLNAVAVLFLLEVDNLWYDYAVSPRIKSAFEITQHADFRLSKTTLQRINVQKAAHLCLIPCAILVCLQIEAGPTWVDDAARDWFTIAIVAAISTALPALIEDVWIDRSLGQKASVVGANQVANQVEDENESVRKGRVWHSGVGGVPRYALLFVARLLAGWLTVSAGVLYVYI